MRKLTYILSAFVLLVSCSEDLTDMNENPKAATEVGAETLFSNATVNLADFVSSANVNVNVFKLYAQYWTQTTYVDESNYQLTERNIPSSLWNNSYRDVIIDLEDAKRIINEDQALTADVKANQIATIEVVEVYAYYLLVTTFGPVPYNEALDFNNASPAYDDPATIYADLMTRLNTAISDLDTGASAFGSSDVLYNGDVEGWVRFANSLKLRMAITIADSDASAAQTAFEEVVTSGMYIADNSQNADIEYLSAPPNTNPIWVDLVQSGRQDFVAANTAVDALTARNDPRIDAYYDPAPGGGYVGGSYGDGGNTYSNSSVIDGLREPASETDEPDVVDPTFPGTIIGADEVHFILAEGAARGWNAGDTAENLYEAAITVSMNFWGITDQAAINTYLGQATVSYSDLSTAGQSYKQIIGEQKWLALYLRGHQAWTEWRRLDYPQLNPPGTQTYADIPVRFTYPINEQNLNSTNYQSAVDTYLGGSDNVSTRLFFDTTPSPFLP